MEQKEYEDLLRLLDDRYVLQADCNDKQEKVNGKFANDDKRIEKLIDRFETWNKLLWIITSAAVGGLVTALLNLILK